MAGGELVCGHDGCQHSAITPMHLGLHRKRVHGIAGSKTKKGRPRADRPPRSTSSAPRAPKVRYAPALTAYAGMIGTAVSAMGMAKDNVQLAYDGQVIVDNAEAWAMAWERLAANDPKVARVLDVIVSSSQWGEVITVTAAMVVPIMACHRLIPGDAALLVGAPMPPEAPPKPERKPKPPRPRGHVNGSTVPTAAPPEGFLASDPATGPPGPPYSVG